MVLRFVLILVQCFIGASQLIQSLILGVGISVYRLESVHRLKIAKSNVVTAACFVPLVLSSVNQLI